MFGLLHAGLSGKQLVFRGVAAGFLLLVLLGLDPQSDVIAHIGGFLAGVVFGGILSGVPSRLSESRLANRLAELLCVGLVILTWWRAAGSVQ